MAKTVPEPPYKIPLIDKSGRVSHAWLNFFREVYIRIGGELALTNIELEDAADLSAVQASITALESQDLTHSSDITNLETDINDLKQGRAV